MSFIAKSLAGGSGGSSIGTGMGGGNSSIYQGTSDIETGDFKTAYSTIIRLALTDLSFPVVFENFIAIYEFDGDNLVNTFKVENDVYDWTWIPGGDTSIGVLEVVAPANILTLINNAVEMFERHRVNTDGGIHGAPDIINEITATYPATTIVEGIALGADLYTQYEAHRILVAGLEHTNPDAINTIASASPTDRPSLITFLNEFRDTTGFNDHIALTAGPVHGADGSVDAITADTISTFGAANTFVVVISGPPKDDLDLLTILGGPGIHRSPLNFDAVRTNNTDITIGGVTPMVMDPDLDDIIAVKEFTATRKERRTYTRREGIWTWTAGAAGEGVLKITGATIQASSTLIVYVQGPEHNTKVLSDAGDAAARGKIVQHQDLTGAILRSLSSLATAGYVRLTDGALELGLLLANVVALETTPTVPTKPIDLQGNLITGGRGTAGGLNLYGTPYHFTATRFSDTELDLAGEVVSLISAGYQFVEIHSFDASGDFVETYKPTTNRFTWDAANSRIAVVDAAFVAGGSWDVRVLAADRDRNAPGNFKMIAEVNQAHLQSDSVGIDLLPGGAQTITDAFLDISPVQNVFGKSSASGLFQLDIGDDEGIEFRALLLQDPVGADEYPAQILSPLTDLVEVRPLIYNLANDTDQYVPLSVPMAKEISGVQWQVRRLFDGAGVDAVIDAAFALRGV